MKSVSYFNIKLLCLAFLFSASHTHTMSHRIPGYDPELIEHLTTIELTTKKTYNVAEKIQETVTRQKGRGRLNKILFAALLLETAYIASEQTESEIAASLEKKWTALKEQCTTLYKSMTISKKNEEDKSSTSDNQSDKKE